MRKFIEDSENFRQIVETGFDKYYGVNDLTWSQISEMYGGEFKPEQICRMIKFMVLYRENFSEEDDDVAFQKELQLKKEKVKVQDQRRELQRMVRELARMEQLQETFLNITANWERVNIFQEPLEIERKNREGLLMISDVHFGLKVDNEVNHYDVEECKRSFKILYQDAVNLVKLHGLRKMTVLLGGDLVSGIIHTTLRLEQQEDAIQQVIGICDILEEFLKNLEQVVDLEVVYTIGNHSRLTPNYKEHLDSENFEHLIAWHLKSKGINVKMNFRDIAEFNIAGFDICAMHGHQTSKDKAVEYLAGRTKKLYYMIVMAHYHSDVRIDKAGSLVVVNGSMIGTDSYALLKGYNSVPHQKIIIFEEGIGEIDTFKSTFRR